MSYDSDLLDGLFTLIAAQADPRWNLAWDPTGEPYPAGVTPMFNRKVPQVPDRVVAGTIYTLGDDPVYGDSDRGLQVRTRSEGQDPGDSTDLQDDIADVLVGNYPLTLPNGLRVQTTVRTSAVSLGQDANQRWEDTANYTLSVYRPGPHRQ